LSQQQDDYFYEIQLTNKQLVFYFLAGALGLILSFLAGVMVGRGVDGSAADAQAAKPVQEERIVAEEPARPSPPAAEELTYAQRLEGEKSDDTLEKTKPGAVTKPAAAPQPVRTEPAVSEEKAAPATGKAAPAPAKPSPAPRKSPAAKASPAAGKQAPASTPDPTASQAPAPSASPKPAPAEKGAKAKASPSPKPAAGGSAIQVGAFKDRETAESVVARLKKKGFAAYVATPSGNAGLFNVRVGPFAARADAERALQRLRDEEKFKPFIVKN
jgi:cell division protein FtsN